MSLGENLKIERYKLVTERQKFHRSGQRHLYLLLQDVRGLRRRRRGACLPEEATWDRTLSRECAAAGDRRPADAGGSAFDWPDFVLPTAVVRIPLRRVRNQSGCSQTGELGLAVRGDVLLWDGSVSDFRVVGRTPFRGDSRQTVGQRDGLVAALAAWGGS